jgi:hypothetical protein
MTGGVAQGVGLEFKRQYCSPPKKWVKVVRVCVGNPDFVSPWLPSLPEISTTHELLGLRRLTHRLPWSVWLVTQSD